MPAPIIDLCTLADFALANLNSMESLKVDGELKRNPHALRNLEFILKIIAHCDHQIMAEVRRSETSTPSNPPAD
jgi:hypothetical protein